LKNNLKVLHVIPILGCGGAEVLIGDIVRHQFLLGYDVRIACLYQFHETFDNFPNKDFIIQNIPIYFINTRVEFSILGRTKVIGNDYQILVEKFSPAIIHSHLYEAELVSLSYVKEDIKYISHIHDNIIQFKLFTYKDLINKLRIGTLIERKWLLSRYLKAQSVFLCISNDVMDYIKINFPPKLLNNAIFLPNAIDTSRFDNKKIRKLDTIQILSVGNLVKKKNHNLLIDIALKLLERSIFDFRIDILGYGPLHDELNRRIIDNNLESYIFLNGSVGNVPEYYSSSNLYVHPATYEPFGLAIIEAMASGLPIISLNGKGNSDLIINGKNGYIIEKNNPTLFVDIIENLFNSPNLYEDISNYGRFFSKKYDIINYVKKLEEIYLTD